MTQENSSEGLISTLKGFQMDADEVGKIVDVANEVAKHIMAKLAVMRGV